MLPLHVPLLISDIPLFWRGNIVNIDALADLRQFQARDDSVCHTVAGSNNQQRRWVQLLYPFCH